MVINPTSATDQRNVFGHTLPGIWQQRRVITAEELQQGHLVPCDPGMPEPLGALIEPLGTVTYGFDLVSRCVLPAAVAVIGGGTIGLLYAVEARRRGVDSVFLLDPSAARLNWAVEQGIVAPGEAIRVNRRSGRIEGSARRLRGGVDAAFLCTPRAAALTMVPVAAEITRPGGVVDLVGGIADQDRIHTFPGVELNAVRRANVCGLPVSGVYHTVSTASGKVLHLTGHRGASAGHLMRAMHLLLEAPERFARLITHVVPLSRAPAILFRILSEGRRDIAGRHAVKIILDLVGRF